jgi:membrane protein DedA with SNARE-associated domain
MNDIVQFAFPAAISRTSRIRFLGLDAVGAGLYSGAYAALGYVFSHDLERVAAYAGRAGTVLAGLALAGLLLYTVRRYRLTHKSRLVQATPSGPRELGETVSNP